MLTYTNTWRRTPLCGAAAELLASVFKQYRTQGRSESFASVSQQLLATQAGLLVGTGSIFGDSIIATAILDRLQHHSTTINIRGESYRLKDRRKAGLVPPRGQEGAEPAARSLASDSVTPKTRQKTALGSTPSEAKEAHQ